MGLLVGKFRVVTIFALFLQTCRERVPPVFGVCNPLKIFDAVIGLDAIDVIDLRLAVGIRNKRFGNETVNV